jgi:mannose-6-phosphate isomerase-like protein (cupin superfamily)
MKVLHEGATVIDESECTASDGIRRFRTPISREMGARDIAQTVSSYLVGETPTLRNPKAEEVLYVVRGLGACYMDGHRYALAPGTALYIPPAIIYQIENTGEDGGQELLIVSVLCPEQESETNLPAVPLNPRETAPLRTVRESDQQSIETGDRTFKIMISRAHGCEKVTQFVGRIPPGRAPMHHHTYEEAIYIIEGEGRLWTAEGDAEFKSGASIYLPRGVSHSLENTGQSIIRLLGVFHPSGSPAARYEDSSQ